MLTRFLSRFRSVSIPFWLTTAVLLLLYSWTLTETVPLRVEVDNGQCTAVLADRSSSIPCPDLAGAEVAAYATKSSQLQRVWYRPLEALTPGTAWKDVILIPDVATGEAIVLETGNETAARKNDGQPLAGTNAYLAEARVQRPDGEHVGILLQKPGDENGLLFMVDSLNRQGIWRHWRGGQPAEPIAGVPYQKPLLAQSQSLLRKIIATFVGALLIITFTLLVQRFGRLVGRPFNRRSISRSAFHVPAIALPIVLAVFGFALWTAVDLLEMIPHVQDSITYLFQAQTMAEGALWAPVPPMSEAFGQEFLIARHDKWFGQYPPGYPAVLALGVLAGGHWLVNPWLAALSVALLVKLGSLLYRSSMGLLAGGLALLSPFFIFLSGSLMVHAAESFWTLLLMVSWTLAMRKPDRLRWPLLAGGGLGMLLLTRQITAVAAGGTFVALMLLAAWWAGRAAVQEPSTRVMGKQSLGLLLAALPFLLLLLGYQAALTGSPWQDPRLLGRPFDKPGFGPHIGESENAFTLNRTQSGLEVNWFNDPSQPPRGHSLARGLFNTEKNLEALAGHLSGFYPLFALAFCWLPFLLDRPRLHDWVLLGVFLAVVAAYVAYWTTGIMYGPRYYYAALPALLLLTARGLQTLARRYGALPTAAVFITLVLLALTLYWPHALGSLRDYNFISGEERNLVEGSVEGPALIIVPTTDWWDYGQFFSGNTPSLDGRIIYARDRGPLRNACLQLAFPERAAYVWQPALESVIEITNGDCLDSGLLD